VNTPLEKRIRGSLRISLECLAKVPGCASYNTASINFSAIILCSLVNILNFEAISFQLCQTSFFPKSCNLSFKRELGDVFLFLEKVFGVAICLHITSLNGLHGASELKLGLHTSPSMARSEPSPGLGS
jgi:hypothetical protein